MLTLSHPIYDVCFHACEVVSRLQDKRNRKVECRREKRTLGNEGNERNEELY